MTTTKNLSSLLLLKQGRDKSLRSFIKRYHEEVMGEKVMKRGYG